MTHNNPVPATLWSVKLSLVNSLIHTRHQRAPSRRKSTSETHRSNKTNDFPENPLYGQRHPAVTVAEKKVEINVLYD